MKRKTGVNNNDRDSSIVTDSITGQTVSDGDKAWVEEDRLIVLLQKRGGRHNLLPKNI